MKRLTGKEEKFNIWKWLAIGSVAFVIAFSVIIGFSLNWNAEDGQEAREETALQMETKAVINEKKAVRNFLNQPAPAVSGDNRQVFRIIEVIPHVACSVFPYLVEWGVEKEYERTVEEYDKNTPLGYDGIMLSAQMGGNGNTKVFNMFSEKDTIAKNSRPFTYVEEKEIEEYLSNYDVDLYSEHDGQRSGNWVRKTKDEKTLIKEDYGYFEYVGAGKGLYYINTSLIAGIKDEWGNVTSTEGVHFEIQAVPRDGTKPGYMFACDPAYFWSREHGNDKAKPKYNGKDVVGLTGYNYDLKFTADKTNGSYIVSNVVYSAVEGDEYAYDIKVKESEVAGWKNGFYYQKGGFYEVASYEEATNGKYIRYADPENNDGVDPGELTQGYFLLEESGKYEGATRYDVVFKEAVNGNGSYMAKAPDSFLGDEITYIYQGKGKGSYKVSFLYAPGSTDVKYASEIMEVSNGQGAYALATTSTDGDGKAKYSKEKSVADVAYDYAEVVTKIDAYAGEKANKWATVDGKDRRKGVTDGSTYGGEIGGWVFVPLAKAEDMKQTFLKDVKTDSDGRNSNTNEFFDRGDRIYVTNQERVYRYYSRAGLENNEWFKLLCYSNNPKSDPKNPKPYTEIIDGVGYDLEKTVDDNLNDEITKQLLKAFDGQYRIEIIQKEPQYLTEADVESADLIYISNQEGINGITEHWNEVNEKLKIKGESLPECDWKTCCKLTDEQDISSAVLMKLYDECIYKRNRALIVVHSVLQEDVGYERTWPITRNLTKLYHMMNYFDNALSWACFMPDKYPEVANKNYSKIRTPEGYETATVDVYKGGEYNTYNHVFLESIAATPSPSAGASPTPYPYPKYKLEEWDDEYFQVYTAGNHSSPVVQGFEFQDDIGHWANIVQDGETKMTVAYYIDPLFMSAATKSNIWKILRNRNLDNSMLVVEVTNGEATGETVPRRVIYADEFDPKSFDIKYKVLMLGSSKKPSTLESITLTFEDGSAAGSAEGDLKYGDEYTSNVRHGFTIDGSSDGALDPSKTVRKVTITAKDNNGKTASAEVYVIVREAFMLN